LRKTTIIFIFLSSLLQAQLKQDTSKNVNYQILPALFRTPETGWAYGAAGQATFKTTHRNDTLTRTSFVSVFGVWTERGQNIQSVDAVIYFPKEKYIMYFDVGHSYFPENFWGIGPNTKDDWHERYVAEQYGGSIHVKKKLVKRLFAGLLYDFQNVFKIRYDAGGVFDTIKFTGKKPYQISGAGMSLSYDTRNKAFWPTKGFYINTIFTGYDKTLGSSYNFSKWTLDIRIFQKLFFDHILAAQFYNYSTFGETPMKNLPRFGGTDNMRGFYQGRLRDKNMTSLIVEYRAPVWWRFSLVAFGGVGNVYSDKNPLWKNDFKYSFGGGVRLSMLEKDRLNIRVDYGYYSKYNSGFYFTLGECF
jgi:outer membrane protein assembly factor BamA